MDIRYTYGYTSLYLEERSRILSQRRYELPDQLGNVHSSLSDRKQESKVINDIMAYLPQTASFTDYYPFGFPMPKRNESVQQYRYGFNGQEKDNEVYGEGASYSFEFRNYDSRLGRFWSVDPIWQDYPWVSPYAFAENRPIDGIDLEGLEYLNANDSRVEFLRGELHLKVSNFLWINRKLWETTSTDPRYWTDDPQTGQKDAGQSTLVGRLIFEIPEPPMARMGTPWTKPDATRTPVEGPPSPSGKTSLASASSGSATMARGILALDILNTSAQVYMGLAQLWDNRKIEKHNKIADKVVTDVINAIKKDMIPSKYMNKTDLSNIMNVILQGENNTNDPEIHRIGMDIFNTISKERIENEKQNK